MAIKDYFGKVIIALLGIFLILLLPSCKNLPGRERDLGTGSDSVQVSENSEPQSNYDSGMMIQNNSVQTWTEPETGPTVTPIVLMPEKRGESVSSAGLLESEPYDETYTYDSNSYDSAPEAGTQSLQAPAASSSSMSPGVMKDEMEVVSFRPFSGSVVLPNQALHLDITLRNTGTTTWQTSYKIVDYSNMAMTVQHEYNLPYAVAPGSTVLVSVYMASPSNLGSYPANFQIQDSYGVVFGQFDYILTVGAFSSITEIPTLTPSVTPTYYSASGITATPDSLAWMCIDPERSKLQDCYQFCVEYSHRKEFEYCFYNGERYKTPIP